MIFNVNCSSPWIKILHTVQTFEYFLHYLSLKDILSCLQDMSCCIRRHADLFRNMFLLLQDMLYYKSKTRVKNIPLTSFQMPKWPQTKIHTISDIIFREKFFMLFHMVWSILFGVLALKTLKWKFLIGCWRISTNEKVVSQANTPNKMDHTKWKSIENCAWKWSRKLCAFLFEVTWAGPLERCDI